MNASFTCKNKPFTENVQLTKASTFKYWPMITMSIMHAGRLHGLIVSNAFMSCCHCTNVPTLQWQEQTLPVTDCRRSGRARAYPVKLIQLRTLHADSRDSD